MVATRYTSNTVIDGSAFNDVLSSLEISGTLLLAEEYVSPWAITIPEGRALAASLSLPEGTITIPFHLVRRGTFTLEESGSTPLLLRAGEVVICTGSQAHTMRNGDAARFATFKECLGKNPWTKTPESRGETTEIICGVFMLRNSRNNPLLGALPSRIHADITGRGGKTLDLLAKLLIGELEAKRDGKGYMLARSLELFCAEAIRSYMENAGTQDPGWFRGLNDKRLGPILNQIHLAPSAPLSVASMARSAGMSQSRFAARFRSTLGESPMSYVSRWRMNLASRLLTGTDSSIETIANQVGYESLPAFSRAFRKHFAQPPGKWRKAHAASAS